MTAVENVPKANERYAMATVESADAKAWRVCLVRGTVKKGDSALFVTPEVAFPNEARFREAFHVKERVFRYGFGVTERVLLPHVSRSIYRNNAGLLCPIARFKELRPKMGEIAVMRVLKLQLLADLRAQAQMPTRPKEKHVFRVP